MEKIYSKIEPNVLLHVINRKANPEARTNLSAVYEFLQVSHLKMPKGKLIRAHKHLPASREIKKVQETLIVTIGKIKAFYYDLDDALLCESILESGDCSITFHGGHSYEVLEEGTEAYEVKTGPYIGQENDMSYFDEDRKNV